MIRLPNWSQFLLIILAAVLVYWHTLDVPFYLDDFSSIFENPVIYGGGGLGELWQYAPLRIVGYATFAGNFQLHHSEPAPYHLVNILIHILAGLSVFALIRGLLRTPAMDGGHSKQTLPLLPLFVALLFVVHPLQTQAVTYVVQRLASLAALWTIASLACYVYGRLVHANGKKRLMFGLSFLFAGLGFLTKQNTFVLPLLAIVLELIFFPATRGRTMWTLLSGGIALLFIWAVPFLFMGYDSLSLASLDAYTRETKDISRFSYFLTQTHVLWVYIKLFFWPVGLHLEHNVDLIESFANWKTGVALLAHIFFLMLSVLTVRRYPLFAFGILFYYISHLVESSFIPIRDLFFEHRAYLPNVGLCLSTGWLLFSLPGRLKGSRTIIAVVSISLLLVCGILAWQRNEVWRDPIKLWYDSAIHAPYKARPWDEYGKHLVQQGRHQEAVTIFQETVQRIHGKDASPGLVMEETAAVNLLIALEKTGQQEAALLLADDFLTRDAKAENKSKILTNKGNLLFRSNQLGAAEKSYRQAIKTFDKNLFPMNNLAILLITQHRYSEAADVLGRVLSIDPEFEASRDLLNKLKAINVVPDNGK